MTRPETALTLRMGEGEVGILAPLPASLTRAQLVEAITAAGGDLSNFPAWLSDRLFAVTARRYEVRNELGTWEQDGPYIKFEGYRVLDAS